jgi:tRNA threonylcarbamoyl adenosine modification protein YeaZ
VKLLAWDTSSKVGALVTLQWQAGETCPTLVSEWTLHVDATHSERLLWAIHELLEASRWRLEEVDLFGVGVGPGSFTGLRIGITTARTLAHALKKPLIGVSSLAVLARPVAEVLQAQKKKALVIAATEACKGEFFALWGLAARVTNCVVKAEGDLPGLWTQGVEELVLRPELLITLLQKKIRSEKQAPPWVAVGSAREHNVEIWKKLPQSLEIQWPSLTRNFVQGKYLGQLVWEAFQASIVRQALQVHPRYLRASDAECRLKIAINDRAG